MPQQQTRGAADSKIVLILGNGFDLDLGLRTEFGSFWETDFCPKHYPAPLIHYLNEFQTSRKKVRWYDLENELKEYYTKVRNHRIDSDVLSAEEISFIKHNEEEAIEQGKYSKEDLPVLESLVLKGYFEKQALKGKVKYHVSGKIKYSDLRLTPLARDKKAFKQIKTGLCKYISSIRSDEVNYDSVATKVFSLIAKINEQGFTVSVYSFNYTTFPEDLYSQYNGVIQHVHGDCREGRIIIGTQDDETYIKSYDFLQKSFDPNFNPPAIVPDLLDATDVIIFGHSIGENDRQYFKAFFKQLTNTKNTHRINLTIFTLNDSSEMEIKRALQKMTDSNLSVLYSQNALRIIKTDPKKYNDDLYHAFESLYI